MLLSSESLQIRELKDIRATCQALDQRHDDKKTRYGKISAKFASERKVMDNDCKILQEKWLYEERTYHHLRSISYIARSKFDRVRMEEDWRAGKDRFLPEFNSLHDFYQNKLSQQENLSKQLRKEQRRIKENKDSDRDIQTKTETVTKTETDRQTDDNKLVR